MQIYGRPKKIQTTQPTENVISGWKNFENMTYIQPIKEKNKNDK